MAERNGGWAIGTDSISLIGDSTREDQDQATAERGRVYRDKFLIRKGLYILRVMYRPSVVKRRPVSNRPGAGGTLSYPVGSR